MDPEDRKWSDVTNGPGRMEDPGDEDCDGQTSQNEGELAAGIAPGYPPLRDSCLPGSEDQDRETNDTVENDEGVAPGGGPDRLSRQAGNECACQQQQQSEIRATSAEATTGPRGSVSLGHNRGNNVGYSSDPIL